jgi:multiple sugar transport system substrate-binding protein
MTSYLRTACVTLCLLVSYPVLATEKLVIDFMASSGPQRTEWNKLLKAFRDANPDVELQASETGQNEYKQRFAQRIRSTPVDVAFWFAGAKLNQAISQNLLQALSDKATLALVSQQFAPATLKAVSISGQVYGVPLSYYQWGFFYKKSTFAKLKLTPPTDWAEYNHVAQSLRAAGIVPTAVGAKNGWPAMAWFDYLNIRTNGLEFHRKLLLGQASFTDPKVVKVFTTWRDMLERGDFHENGVTQDWDEVLPYLYRDFVGMALMGAFAATKFPPNLEADMGFFPFPQMTTPAQRFEDAPLDLLVFPASGKNQAATLRFVRFLAQSNALSKFNESTEMISPRIDAPTSNSRTLAAGKKLLDEAAGISFFFDRDASAPLAEAGNKVFLEFLKPPHDVNKAIQALDAASRLAKPEAN